MNTRVLLAAGCLALQVSSLLAVDRVKRLNEPPIPGKITEITAQDVTVEQAGVPKKVGVNEIDSVTFEGEPPELAQARVFVNNARYADAMSSINKIDLDAVKRPEVKQDIEFYKAIAATRAALAGSANKSTAGKLLAAFSKNNPASFHFLEAEEAMGDLFMSLGKVDSALPFYAKLAATPWPDYQMRAAVLTGRALETQKQYDKAIKKYEEVISRDMQGKEADKQRLSATLGKATSLSASGKTDDAIKLIEGVIAKADPEQLEVHARAYNALGECYLAAGKKKEAMLAFLHVDVLYAGFPEQHAQALYHLSKLWTEADKAQRAVDASRTLKEKYPNSRWAQQ